MFYSFCLFSLDLIPRSIASLTRGVPIAAFKKSFPKQKQMPSKTKTGFNFDNCVRNDSLNGENIKQPIATSTGTTIVGLIYKDGKRLSFIWLHMPWLALYGINCHKLPYPLLVATCSINLLISINYPIQSLRPQLTLQESFWAQTREQQLGQS